MHLEKDKQDKLYELLFYLLDYTNNKYKINKKLFNKLDRKEPINPEEITGIRDKLWENNSVIEEYINKNPNNLSEKDLKIIESWKNRIREKFIMAKHLKTHTMLMDGKNVYGILGISTEISEIIPANVLPIYVETVLLPFEDVIVYDTLLLPYMIRFGGGFKATVNEEYMKIKRKNAIIYSLNSDSNIKNKKTESTKQKKEHKYYEIKVAIKNTKPPVWRRLQIPEGITFHELNAIIQLAFGWCGYHAYNFEVGRTLQEAGTYIELPNIDNIWGGHKIKDSQKEKIDKYFKKYQKMQYTYDFGDDWVHDIIIEKIIETDFPLVRPICIKAKMANIPEDCGGPWGYEELLEILSDPKHERYSEMKEWVESGFSVWYDDRTFVDIDEINMRLQDYKKHAEFLLSEE